MELHLSSGQIKLNIYLKLRVLYFGGHGVSCSYTCIKIYVATGQAPYVETVKCLHFIVAILAANDCPPLHVFSNIL